MKSIENVAKFGSNLVTNEQGIDRNAIAGYVAGFYDSGMTKEGLVVVTSGAVAAGRQRAKRLFDEEKRNSLTLKQEAGLGAVAMFSIWEQLFDDYGVAAMSAGVTHHQLAGRRLRDRVFNRQEKLGFRDTLLENGRMGIVTIINEADMQSNVELMKLCFGGDNDGLSSHLAQTVDAGSLTVFASIGGIFDENKQLITVVDDSNIADVREIAAGRDTSSVGRGGLTTKIDACWEAAQAGVHTRIAGVNESMSGADVTTFCGRIGA